MTYEDLKNKNWNLPKECFTCGSPLIYTGSRVYCSNPNCKEVITHRLNKWITTLDVKNFGPALQKFVIDNNYVKSLPDLYDINIQEKVEKEWGLNAVKAFNDLNSKKNIPLAKLIAGFDIEELGQELFQLLVDEGYNTVDSILNITFDEMVAIKGWGDIRAKSFIEGRKDLVDNIKTIANRIGIQAVNINEKSSLTGIYGKTICVTGKLNNYSRKEIETAIKENGGIVSSSVTSKTDILCTNDQTSGSSKLKNAAKYGTKIITEDELIEMMKSNE